MLRRTAQSTSWCSSLPPSRGLSVLDAPHLITRLIPNDQPSPVGVFRVPRGTLHTLPSSSGVPHLIPELLIKRQLRTTLVTACSGLSRGLRIFHFLSCPRCGMSLIPDVIQSPTVYRATVQASLEAFTAPFPQLWPRCAYLNFLINYVKADSARPVQASLEAFTVLLSSIRQFCH